MYRYIHLYQCVMKHRHITWTRCALVILRAPAYVICVSDTSIHMLESKNMFSMYECIMSRYREHAYFLCVVLSEKKRVFVAIILCYDIRGSTGVVKFL